MLPQSEEGEAHDEVGGLDEAVIGQEVLVGALREEDRGVTEFSLHDRGVHIVAEYLILKLIVDIACGVFSWLLVDIHEVFKTYAAKRGSD